MSLFEQFYIPSSTGNVIDFAGSRARYNLYQQGVVDESGNFYADRHDSLMNPDWVALYRRSQFSLIDGSVELDTASVEGSYPVQ